MFFAYDVISDNSGEDGISILTPIPIANESGNVEKMENSGIEASAAETTDESRKIIEDSTSAAEKQKEVNSQINADSGCLKGQTEKPAQEGKPLIAGYQGAVKLREESLQVIKNSAFYYGEGLQGALIEYQDTVNYRVVVKVYKDGYEIATNSSEVNSEMERLGAAGYTVAYETSNDGDKETCLFTLHATYDQLMNFNVNEQYGYYILLYDQAGAGETSYVYPEVNNQNDYALLDMDAAADESGIYREATPYPDDILELQKRVSADMSAGNLPFVISSSIVENPLRLEICVITQDNNLIDQVKAYDPEEKYIRVLQVTKEIATEDLATYKE